MRRWTPGDGVNVAGNVPQLHPESWVEAPVVIQAVLAPMNLIRVGAFTGIYGGRLGHCSIGRYCSIAPGVDIASDQHPADWVSTSMMHYVPNIHGWGNWLQNRGHEYREPTKRFSSNTAVEIGNDVWIGQGAFVKSGVEIGHGAVIGAHAVVVDNVPPYAIAAGVPARVKRYRFAAELVDRLVTSEWWNYNLNALPDIDFSDVERVLDRLAVAVSSGELKPLLMSKYGFTDPA